MKWIYLRNSDGHGCITVGFYDPEGKFQGDSDHDSIESAAARVNYLNGERDLEKYQWGVEIFKLYINLLKNKKNTRKYILDWAEFELKRELKKVDNIKKEAKL